MQLLKYLLSGSLGFLFMFFLVQCKADQPKEIVQSKRDSALEQLTSLIMKSPEEASLFYDRGQFYYQAEDYDKSIADLKKAISLDSLQPQAYHLLSDVYMDYYRSKDALQIMEEAGELFPKRIATLLKLSETQLILKQNEHSLLTVAQILTLEPQNAEAHFMTGLNFRAIGEIDRAIAAFQRATEIDPKLTDAWLIAADLMDQKGMALAEEYYDAATRVDPDNPSTWHSKAFYLQNNGQEKEALALYRKINLIDKNYTDAYLNPGILYMTMDSLGPAKEQFTIMSKIVPQNHLPYYYLGLIFEAEENFSKSRMNLENCLNLKPDFSKAKVALDRISTS